MPKLNLDDTIAALSTPPGEGGLAVIRVSGRDALRLTEAFFQSTRNGRLSEAHTHTIHHGYFAGNKGERVDEVLVSIFRAPHSYTGEEVVEISCHGGVRVSARILECLWQAGARPAEPGEFTKRAFLHGKMDLTQAEAVLDLIRARSEAALESAVHQLQGSLSKRIQRLKDQLMKIYAHLEASLDFPDERLEVYSKEECCAALKTVQGEIQSLLASFKRGQLMREGVLTVIVGRPNVGKSSLLNCLLERDRALVSPYPGTTRDALEETVEIGGLAVRLVDTAGLWLQSRDALDQMGMERTRDYLKRGQLFLFMVDGSEAWTDEDEAILAQLREKDFLLVINKCDLPPGIHLGRTSLGMNDENLCRISCLKQTGIQELEEKIEKKIRDESFIVESGTLTRIRHKEVVERAQEAMERCERSVERGESPEFVLEDLKAGMEWLQELTGEIYSEDLLGVIFQEFCIGK